MTSPSHGGDPEFESQRAHRRVLLLILHKIPEYFSEINFFPIFYLCILTRELKDTTSISIFNLNINFFLHRM